jgi:hypothetical protein
MLRFFVVSGADMAEKRSILEATGRFELPIELLQSPALPLGYVAE